ncbi:MAG TPA: hypothetical protein VGC76_06560 [Pyrinomonadaceae bacterium]|jgi:hypothetical protein
MFFLVNCQSKREVNARLSEEMPPKILWAWEREEDLRFIDPKEIGVAFLAQTLFLQNEEIIYKPRRQSLEIAPETYLIAVTRIETSKEGGRRPAFSASQVEKITNLVKNTLERPNVKAVQIDFDAVGSERKFYRELITKIKNRLPDNTPLTMTALASWCAGDSWFNDFPVDEAVPMAFEMGADSDRIRSFLAAGNDWREPLCKGSYGISIDEPLIVNFKPNRRFYYFKSKAWDKNDLEKIR